MQDSFRREALKNYLMIIQPILDEWILRIGRAQGLEKHVKVKIVRLGQLGQKRDIRLIVGDYFLAERIDAGQFLPRESGSPRPLEMGFRIRVVQGIAAVYVLVTVCPNGFEFRPIDRCGQDVARQELRHW